MQWNVTFGFYVFCKPTHIPVINNCDTWARRLLPLFFRMRSQKLRYIVTTGVSTCYDKDPIMLKGHECRTKVKGYKGCKLSTIIMVSPYKCNIFEWDAKQFNHIINHCRSHSNSCEEMNKNAVEKLYMRIRMQSSFRR